MRTGVIIQARSTSTRLPEKVLKELPYGSGITVLEQVTGRLKKASSLNEIIVATTTNREDDKIVALCDKEGITCFRGSEGDVLSRYYHAAKENDIEIVVRVTSDCPCIDPEVVDHIVGHHQRGKSDYTSNTLKRTYPHGLDTEVFSFEALSKSYMEAKEEFEREHVTPYLYRTGKFSVMNIEALESLTAPDIRITLDTIEDYALLCAVFDSLYEKKQFFSTVDIIGLFERKPWLMHINGKVVQKKIFDSLEDELKEAVHIMDLQDMKRAREYISRIIDGRP